MSGETGSAMLGAYGMSCAYSGRTALDEVSFELQAGSILAVIGPNGSGKSTLLKSVAGLIPAARGVVRHRGVDVTSAPSMERARHIAYVGADLHVEFPLKAEEAVLLGRSAYAAPAFRQATRDDEIAVAKAMAQSFCSGLQGRMLHTLSGGERQLVSLARALAQGARTLLLDESLSRMDLNHQQAIGNLLRRLAREEGYGIVLVSHDLNLASEWADQALLLRGGKRIALGPLPEVFTEARIRSLYPGASLSVKPSPETGAPKVFFK